MVHDLPDSLNRILGKYKDSVLGPFWNILYYNIIAGVVQEISIANAHT